MTRDPLPIFDEPILANGIMTEPDPASFPISQVAATAKVTIGGTVTTSDTLPLVFTHPSLPGGTHTVDVTAAGGDTDATLASKFATAINADSTLQGLVTASYTASNTFFTMTWAAGPKGMLAKVAGGTVTGSHTETIMITNQFAGASGYVTPTADFEFSLNGTTKNYRLGQPYEVDYVTVKAMVAAGAPIS